MKCPNPRRCLLFAVVVCAGLIGGRSFADDDGDENSGSTNSPAAGHSLHGWPGRKFPFIVGGFPLAFTRNTARFNPMIADEIRELMHAEPFRPIRIVLGNQQAYVVTHTDYLAVSPDRQSMVLYDEQGHFRVINAQQIRLAEPVNRPASKSG